MSHLPHVAWDEASATPLECLVGISKCLVGRHIAEEVKENPGLFVRNVGRFADFVADRFVPGPRPLFASADEEQAFEQAVTEVAGQLGIAMATGPNQAGALFNRALLFMIARQLVDIAMEWLASLDDGT